MTLPSKLKEPLTDIFDENEFFISLDLEKILHLTALETLKKKRINFITDMQRTKRPTELKISFQKKALININFGNACEYVKVIDSED